MIQKSSIFVFFLRPSRSPSFLWASKILWNEIFLPFYNLKIFSFTFSSFYRRKKKWLSINYYKIWIHIIIHLIDRSLWFAIPVHFASNRFLTVHHKTLKGMQGRQFISWRPRNIFSPAALEVNPLCPLKLHISHTFSEVTTSHLSLVNFPPQKTKTQTFIWYPDCDPHATISNIGFFVQKIISKTWRINALMSHVWWIFFLCLHTNRTYVAYKLLFFLGDGSTLGNGDLQLFGCCVLTCGISFFRGFSMHFQNHFKMDLRDVCCFVWRVKCPS